MIGAIHRIIRRSARDIGRLPSVLLVLLVVVAGSQTAQAVEDEGAEVEDGTPLRVVVFGDSLADGIWAGVYRVLRQDDRFEIDRHTRVASGLSRPDFFDWQSALRDYLSAEPVDVAIISIGLNDGQPVFHEGRWDHDFATPEWNEIYNARVNAFMAELAAAGVPTFWLGLPAVRSDSFGERVTHMNAIYEAAAEANGIHFVSIVEITSDDSGAYSAYLPDANGRQRLMRANDGIHFTGRGYEMVAGALVDVMRGELDVFRVGAAGD